MQDFSKPLPRTVKDKNNPLYLSTYVCVKRFRQLLPGDITRLDYPPTCIYPTNINRLDIVTSSDGHGFYLCLHEKEFYECFKPLNRKNVQPDWL